LIEFIGGPFDGHQQSSANGSQASEILCFITKDAFRQLHRSENRESSSGSTLTSVALYELDAVSDPPTYRHAGSIGGQSFGEVIAELS
jgi:hypothetical protein